MPFLTPARVDQQELLDEHDAPRKDVERSLRDLRRINRYLGGILIYKSLLARFAPVRSVADLGAATADLLESIPGNPLRLAVDFKIDHLLYLRDGGAVQRVVADARQLPFRDGSVDVITSAHLFHHFDAAENEGILAESLRAARRGVAVNDTRRHWAPLFFISLLGWLRITGRITRFDGPASVRRSYTVAEAREVAGRIGASSWKVVHAIPFRFGILLWK